MNQYMVVFKFDPLLSKEFIDKIPLQRIKIGEYFVEDSLKIYTVNIEEGIGWSVWNVENKRTLNKLIKSLPLTQMMKYEVFPLTFYLSNAVMQMSYSLN